MLLVNANYSISAIYIVTYMADFSYVYVFFSLKNAFCFCLFAFFMSWSLYHTE